ncbi:MAG: FtsX-like permease family protein [Chromatiaceae bacterium]|nr:FtsX-like permease family protein [Chromatiaceae bacterium]MCP5440123.1 FtsX-like permease family protein [Chromatiaceae bacterium]
MSAAALAFGHWRAASRDPGLRLLAVAVVVAVAALSSVAFFADRVERALQQQGAALMAADLVIEQGAPVPQDWLDKADALALHHARTLTFPSVIVANDRPLLVQVKAVEAPYPLRGRLRVDTPQGEVSQVPASGTAWLEGRLRDRLGAQIGVTDVGLGELQLRAAGVLVDEPDRGGNLFQLAPRLMLAYDDVQRSGLLGPASRVKYRLLLAGEADRMQQMRAWLEDRLPRGSELADLENARPELRTALERARRFLSLAALCASLLAGVAIMLATRRYVDRALDGAAVLRTLGMSAAAVLRWHLVRLLLVVIVATALGSLGGLVGQQALVSVLGDWFGEALPAPGLRPALVGLLFGLSMALGFAVPTLLRVGRVPPLRVLRREMDAPGLAAWTVWVLAAGGFFGLMVWQVQDLRLAGGMALALAAALASMMLAGRLLLLALNPLRRAGGNAALGLAALARYPQLTLLQLAGFGLGITLLLLLAVVRVDIIDTWQGSLPEQAPNHFLINLQPEERAALAELLLTRQIANSGLYAMARARLVAIGDRQVDPEDYTDLRARRLAAREFNLGFSADMQRDNRIQAGNWWKPGEPPRAQFSVEEGLAKSLGIQFGDTLTFDVAGQTVRAPVTSLRSVAWDSFNVNFFVVAPPQMALDLPVTYLTSLYLDEASEGLTLELVQQFPAVSVIDVRPILAQVRAIMERGALAVEMVFVFTLLAAALVSVAAAQVSRDERAREVAIMRTLGASRRRLLGGLLAEFGLLGLIGGLLAAGLASVSGYVIAVELFELPGRVSPDVWWFGIGGGTLVVGLVGWLATRRLLGVPPLQVLNSD